MDLRRNLRNMTEREVWKCDQRFRNGLWEILLIRTANQLASSAQACRD